MNQNVKKELRFLVIGILIIIVVVIPVLLGVYNSKAPSKSPENLNYRQDWTGMDAQLYLYPALTQNKENVKKIAKEHLKKEIRKLGG